MTNLANLMLDHSADRERPGAGLAGHPGWVRLKDAVEQLRTLQSADGSVDRRGTRARPSGRSWSTRSSPASRPSRPSCRTTPPTSAPWSPTCGGGPTGGFGVPDFLDSLLAFHPERHRVDGLEHLVVFPMYTQNGNPDRNVEARPAAGGLAGLRRRARGRAVPEHAVRAGRVPRLHRRLRHQLRRAVPRDRRHARGSRRSPGARSSATGRPRASAAWSRAAAETLQARPARRRRAAAGRPGADRGDVRDVGPHPRPHPHAAATCRSTRS